MSAYFITATGTNIGKTSLCLALHKLNKNIKILKPVASGLEHADNDLAFLCAQTGQRPEDTTIYSFKAPLSPDQAAEKEGKKIDYDSIKKFCLERISSPALIEGVGGVSAPLTKNKLVADLIADLALPCLLMAGNYLGTISHTLAAIAALRAKGVVPKMIIMNDFGNAEIDINAQIKSISNHCEIPVLPLDSAKIMKILWP